MHYGDDKHGGVDAPISLGGLFVVSDDDDEDGDGFTSNAFEQISEIQTLEIAGMSFEVEHVGLFLPCMLYYIVPLKVELFFSVLVCNRDLFFSQSKNDF